MKKFKKFAKSRWHSIPLGAMAIALVASLAITGTVFAAVTISNLWTSPTITVSPTLLVVSSPDFTTAQNVAVGEVMAAGINLHNPSSSHTYSNVRVLFKIYKDGISEGDVNLQYQVESTWYTLSTEDKGNYLEGYFGPEAGFTVGPSYSVTTPIQATFYTDGSYYATATAITVP